MDTSDSQKKKVHVKKPLNAYFVWSRMLRPKMLEQNPDITVCQANVLLGKIWHGMSTEQKEPYFQESQRIKKQHELDHPDFQSNSKQRDRNTQKKNGETLKKSSEMGDSHLRNNRFYQMPKVMAIPSGQVFLPIAHSNVPGTGVAFYTPYDVSNRMPSCPQPFYTNANPCSHVSTEYNGFIPERTMLPSCPYHHHVTEYLQMLQEEGRIPQECLYQSTPFAVTNAQVKCLPNSSAQENPPHMMVRLEGISSNVSKTSPGTF